MKYIRSWKYSDAEDLALLLNNKNIQDNLRDGLPFPYTKDDATDFISSMLNANENSVFSYGVIFCNKVVGSIGVFRQENIHYRTAELGYYIGQPYWGQGITTNAVKEICGFVFEGVLRKNAEKNGELIDMSMYALIKD